MSRLGDAGLEAVYEAMAETLDTLPPDVREVYLAKLALLMAEALGDTDRALAAVRAARAHLP